MSTEIPQYRFNSPTAGAMALVWTLVSTLASLFVIDTFFSESSFVWALAAALVVNGSVGISGIPAFFHHEGPIGPGAFGLAALKGRRGDLGIEDDDYRSDSFSTGFYDPVPPMFNLDGTGFYNQIPPMLNIATGFYNLVPTMCDLAADFEINYSGIDTGGIQDGHTGWE